jgi:hypothetical protein
MPPDDRRKLTEALITLAILLGEATEELVVVRAEVQRLTGILDHVSDREQVGRLLQRAPLEPDVAAHLGMTESDDG